MPIFKYIAKPHPNKTIEGTIDAESEQEAVYKLTELGYFPISVEAEVITSEKLGFWRLWKIPPRTIILFTQQLSSLISSGIDVLKSLNIILNQTSNKYFRIVLNEVIGKIKDGKSLSESLAGYRFLFSELYTSMIHSGEASGNLEQALKRLADFLEKEDEFKNSISAALIYPFFILAVSVITIIVLFVFVIPRLITMFEDMGQILPLPTKILIFFSGFLRSYWWFILAIIFIAVLALYRICREPQNKFRLDKMKLKLPIAGKVILKTEISRLTRVLSLLLSSGMPVVYSLDIAGSVIGNQVLKLEIQGFKEKISRGLSLSNSIKNSRFFGGIVANIIVIGEETGTLEKSLVRIADDYERDVDRSLKALARILEPVVILAMGLIVGFIVISMLLPIFQINLIVR